MFLEFRPTDQIFLGLHLTLLPTVFLGRQLNQPGFQIASGVLTVTDIRFNGRHFSIDTEKGTLCRLHRIVCRVIGFAQRFQLGLNMALTCNRLFQFSLRRSQARRELERIITTLQKFD